MSDYKELLERVPQIKERIPGVKERMIAIIKAELVESYSIIDNALNVEINAMIKDLDMSASDVKLLEEIVKADGIKLNEEMIANIYKQFDYFEK